MAADPAHPHLFEADKDNINLYCPFCNEKIIVPKVRTVHEETICPKCNYTALTMVFSFQPRKLNTQD